MIMKTITRGRRGRPPKDPAKRAAFYAVGEDDCDAHIIMQLKKAADCVSEPFQITFIFL